MAEITDTSHRARRPHHLPPGGSNDLGEARRWLRNQLGFESLLAALHERRAESPG